VKPEMIVVGDLVVLSTGIQRESTLYRSGPNVPMTASGKVLIKLKVEPVPSTATSFLSIVRLPGLMVLLP
jgi:hypothetical protein